MILLPISEKIKILAVKLNISVAELARRAGQTPQNFNQKMKRESFSYSELEQIAEKLECKFEGNFELKNGEKV